MSGDELQRLRRLSPAKRALLHRLLRGGSEEGAIIPPRPAAEPAPLSHAQERLWLLDRLQPGNGALNMPLALRLHGRLDIRALAASLRGVVRRHEVLRSRVVMSEAGPCQEPLPAGDLPLPLLDLRSLPAAGREDQVGKLAQHEADTGFDLAAGPLLRARLALLAAREQVLLVTVHHLACDGWSMRIMVGEIASLYAGYAGDPGADLPAPPLQYADYAFWQRRGDRRGSFAPQLRYWREALAGAPEQLDLPADYAPGGTPRGAHCSGILSPDTVSRLRALVRAEQVTPFMALFGVFAALLSRLSGQHDLVIGTPVADRGHSELEQVIGCFLNTLALRADLSRRPSFRELLRRTSTLTLGALANQEVPFEEVLAEVRQQRAACRNPLFRAFFNMLNYPSPEIRLPGLEAEPPQLPAIPSKFDLTLYVAEQGDALHLTLVYSADLFAPARMQELLRQYELLLLRCLEVPTVEIDHHSLVTGASRALLPDPLEDLPPGDEGPIQAGFLAQAARSPAHPAVAEAGRSWSRGEIEAASRRLATVLRGAGLERGDRVAIFGARSAALVTSLLGVLRSGGAFVILDPAYPARRLATCAGQAAPRALVECGPAELPAELAAALAAIPARLRVRLTRDLELTPDAAAAAHEGWREASGPDDLAYVAFTSGSTGLPKGIAGTHRPVSHFLAWYTRRFGLGPGDRFCMLSGLSHDPLLRDVFTPLDLGAVLVVPEPEVLADPRRLIAWLAEQRVTVLHLTPALGRMLAEATAAGGQVRLAALRYACFGGDVLTEADLVRFAAVAPAVRCVNLYGATETPQAMGVFDAGPAADHAAGGGRGRRVPVGTGIAGVQLLVLNAADGLAGVGELGEICVRTPYLARGYLREPPAARSFASNPFTGDPGDRLYRTGDLGRYRWDGAVEIAGRADDQVQVRGFRLEPTEVEAALAQHPAVAAVAVARREDAPGEPRLVAYVVPVQDEAPVHELRAFLRERLPEPMIPDTWMALERLPLTPNGKLDRRALPPPTATAAGRRERRPLTAAQQLMAAVWAEVLGVEPASPDDDFFELGGHSLKAAQAQARIFQRLGVELPLAAFFEAPSLGALAARLGGGAHRPQPPLVRLPRLSDLPLSFAQQRLWFLAQLEPSSSAYHIPLTLRLGGAVDVAALAQSFSALLDRHQVLRARIGLSEGVPRACIVDAELRLPLVDLAALPERKRRAAASRLAAAETTRPFDLDAVPWARACLLRLAPAEHLLLLTLHHLAADGWSLGVLIRDLAAFYQAFSLRRAPRLPALPCQYADFAAWQRGWLRGEILDGQLAYWRDRLAGAPGVLDLPFARQRRRRPGGNPGRRLHFRIDSRRRAALAALGRRQGVTLFMTLLAAVDALLARYSGQLDLVVGTPLAGRPRPEVEDLVGCFVNAVALRADLRGNPRFTALLGRVRDGVLGALAHQDLPFELLVEDLQPERSLQHTPLFQVVIALQNAPMPALSAAGLDLAVVELETRTAKFDLIVMVQEWQDELLVILEYDADLFERLAMARMQGHLEALLAAAVADAERPLADLPLLTPAERHQALCEWNDTAASYPAGATLVDLFAHAAARFADRLAVLDDHGAVSYGALDHQSDLVARGLAWMGARPGACVAVWMDRSPAMVVALLGILKTGAAYVPLEIGYPRARVERILASIGIRHLVVTRPQLGAVAALAPAVPCVLCLDAPHAAGPGAGGLDAFAGLPAPRPERLPTAGDLAYVIFTSGSTGQPKGVALCHTPVVNLVAWVNRMFAVGPSDRILQMASLCFDLSVYDIFGLLAAGGSIRIVGEAEVRDPERLWRLLEEEPITFWDSAPAAMQQLDPLLVPRQRAPSSALRLVFLSGDWVPVKLPDRLRAHFPGVRVVSLGGATEAAIWSNFHSVATVDPAWPSIPYGRPIQNARYHILEAGLSPAPIGVPGDLYIGGPVLSSGYAAAPAVTAASFQPDPFALVPGERCYRTGDRARRWADGTIEFLGRADQQVKIRGFRIELGEIEAALVRHPDVRAAVAMVREDEPGDRRLVAYFVGRAGAEVRGDELRAALHESLPAYMLPHAIVRLESLPVSANGKLDRRALPAPAASRRDDERGFVAPRGDAEQTLAAIWREVLRVERVGTQDNFFELGGESILSLQVVSLAARAGLRITSAQIFRFQTIAELAAVAEPSRPPAQPEVVAGPVGLTPVQRWFFAHDLIEPHHFNQALLLELRRAVAPRCLRQAVLGLVQDHPALRLRFERSSVGWTQLALAAEPHRVFSACDLSALPPGRRLAALAAAAEATQASLDFERGPMLRAVFFRLDGGGGRLLLVIHHLAVDGVSWRILLEELQLALAAADGAGERAPARSPEAVSYLRFAERLEEYAQTAAPRRELDHWRALAAQSFAALPAGGRPGGDRVAAARSRVLVHTAEETRALLAGLARAYRIQINEVLLAALAEAWAAVTGEPRLLVDVEGHGREPWLPGVDVSRTVGWFTTIAPLALDVAGCLGPADLLKRVKEQVRNLPSRGFNYGVLRYLAPAAGGGLDRLPRAPVSFNYLGQLDQAFPATAILAPAREASGSPRSPRQQRLYPVEVSGAVSGGCLRVSLSFGADLAEGPAAALGDAMAAALRRLAAHAGEPAAGGFTPSDFAGLGIDQATLDRIVGGDRRIEQILPLTALQQGMLFHSLYEEGDNAYLLQWRCTLRGPVDAALLECAWNEVAGRHAALRTTFAWDGLDEPLQVVRREARPAFAAQSWNGLPSGLREERLAVLAAAERERGCDLAAGPLLRLVLVELEPGVHVLLWTFHHLVLDGWSLPIVLGEVFALYAGWRRGAPAKLPAVRPFGDYVRWLRGRDDAAAEGFWRRELAGFVQPTPLPAGSGSAPAARGEVRERLSQDVTLGLHRQAQRSRVTANTLAVGAWALLLARFADAGEVVFGVTLAGRPPELPGADSMVGLFINTLPLRVPVPLASPPGPWWEELQERQTRLREHEATPLPEIQRWSEVRGLSLFETVWVFESYPAAPAGAAAAAGIEVGDVHLRESTNYPLTAVASPGPGMTLKLLYDGRRIDAVTAGRLLACLRSLLTAIAAEPAAGCLADLPLLGAAERHQIVVEWNATARRFAAEPLLHRLVEAQAAATPHAPALVAGEDRLTHGEVDARASRLAWQLVAAGIGPEDRVGICAERSAGLLIGLLAILKAGAAYVPLDPELPPARLSLMLESAGAAAVLVQPRHRGALAGYGGRLIELATGRGPEGPAAARDLPRRVLPDNLAYVIHTSGSTGRPKAAMNSHRAICNRLLWMQETYGLGPADRVLQKTPISFDVSVWELFWPLLAGACLVMARPGGHRDPSYLAQAIVEHGITTLHFVPTLLRPFLAEPAARACTGLRRVLVSGEALPPDLVAEHFRRLPAEIYNLYGPTEAAVDVTAWAGDRREPAPASVPIGRPIANLRIHLLDRAGMPAPVAAPAELCIGGTGLGRGYLADPALTAAAFVPDPCAAAPGERLYRTGDLARRAADGQIEFLGRIDHQVKVRGVRIEPAEIEAVLCEHPLVRRAVVVARRDGEDTARLVAYVEIAPGRAPAGDELRERVAARLPPAMVPSVVVQLSELPTTASGKVDRRALPAPAARRGERETPFVAPAGPVEEALAALWREVLRLDRIGRDDHFFGLGGDSIVALRLVSRAGRHGLRFTLRQLFEHPTLQALARVAVQAGAGAAVDGPVSGPVRLTPIQRWFFAQDLPEPHHFNQALLLRPRAPLDAALLRRVAASLVEHHDALRLRFIGRGNAVLAHNAAREEHSVFACVDLTALPEATAAANLPALLDGLQASLDFERGPLFRAVSLELPAASGRLLLVAHHLVVDAFSWRILFEDLEHAYGQAQEGRAIQLPPKTTSFQSWAEELERRAGTLPAAPGGGAEPAAGGHTVARFERAPAGAPSVRTLTLELDAPATRAFLGAAPRAYLCRPEELLLAALALALDREAGIRPLRLEIESLGRDADAAGLDVSRTVGWFTLISPLRLDVAAADGPGAAIKRIKEQMAALRRSASLPGGAPRPPGGAGTGPAEVLFNFLGRLDDQLAASRLFAAHDAPGRMRSRRQPRRYLLELNAAVTGGLLEVAWTYDAGRLPPATVERFAGAFAAELRALVAHCTAPGVWGRTPGDFPLAGLAQEEIERLFDGASGRPEDVYPLSPLQEGLLFHSQYAPAGGLYCEQLVWSLRGEIDSAALQEAWRRIVARHPILRTSFLWEGLQRPLQVAWEAAAMPFAEHDWRPLPAAPAAGRLEEWLDADRRRGFDLAAPPLARLALIRLGDGRSWLIWSFHHLLLDGWSLGLVLGEVAAAYAALVRGEEAVLPQRPLFRNYIAWLLRQDEEAAREHWRKALRGVAVPTPLGGERGRSPAPEDGDGFGEQETVLPETAFAALGEVARRYRVTLATVLAAAWALLLSRYGGDDDVVFGTTVSGRSPELAGCEEIVGLLINTLPVRLAVPRTGSAGAWWPVVQARQLAGLSYEWAPLARVQSWSEMAGAPLFESLLVLENYPRLDLAGGHASDLRLEAARMIERPNYPLTVVAVPGDGLLLKVLFATRRFDAAAAARRLGHLAALLGGFAAGPERPLHELSLLSPEEQRQIAAWAGPAARTAPPAATLAALFVAAAARDPGAVAVVAGEERWTYRDLDRRSARLARWLRAHGIGVESIVGVCLERSPELVAALLGVLRAGGAYLPLDPDLPRERLSFILADAGAELVVGRGATLAWAAAAGRTLDLDRDLDLDCDLDLDRDLDREHALAPADPGNLAYVIYTSGSTGLPKGTMVTHANVTRLLAATAPWFGFGSADVWTLFHSFAFDFSVWEVFGALLAGGRLVVVPYLVSRDPEAFLTLLARERVTVLNQTPSAFHQLARVAVGALGGPAHELALRWVVFGGEALDPRALRDWFACFGDRRPRLVNMYGITETTVHVTFRPLAAGDAAAGAPRSPIGVPIPDLALHVLDRDGHPAPIGVGGEIHVGGPGLARGYLGRSDLTAARFVPAPGAGAPGERLYRTGDLGRLLPGGDVEYLGRNDEQLKVRGFRIEPGEIEAVLRSDPAVAACVVTARGEGIEERRLVAYLVPRGEMRPAVAELRRRLAERLPEHMIPQAWVFLAALPLTANGKLDRRALPAPEAAARAAAGAAYFPPATPAEKILAAIWEHVLGVERVGAGDAFFALGGDSILSLQVVARARAAGLDLSLPLLFTHPTLRELAAALDEATAPLAAAPAAAPFDLLAAADRAVLGDEIEDAFPLTRLQAGMLFHGALAPESDLYHDLFSFHLRTPLAAARLACALELLTARHAALRSSFRGVGSSTPLQQVARRCRGRLAVADLSGLPEAAQEARVAADLAALRGARFALDRPPLLRLILHRRGAREAQLTLHFHHALFDGWSIATLLVELFALYRGEPLAAPPAASQREVVALELQELAAPAPRAFWQEEVAAVGRLPEVLSRPRRLPGRPPATPRELTLGAARLAGLERLAAAAGAPLKSVLLAAHLKALGAAGGSREVVTGLVVSVRPETPGGERAVGLFLNTLPLRLALAGGSWVDLVRAVLAAEQRLLRFRRFPLAELQRLHGPRSLCDTLFNFTHFRIYGALARDPELAVAGVVSYERTNFPLAASFNVAAAARQASLRLASDSGALDAADLVVLLGRYDRVLAAMAERPDERHDLHGTLSAAERHQTVVEWNDTAMPPGSQEPVHRLVAAQARRRADAVAVTDSGVHLSWAALNRQASRLAAALVERGIGPEQVVAVFCERSPELVVAVVAALAAGAAYLPLDPSWPQERLAFVLADAGVRAVVTVAALDGRLPALPGLERLHAGGGAAYGPADRGAPPPPPLGPQALAYVIYTSGSTGTPKATALSHGGLGNMAAWYARHYGLTPEDRVSLAAAPGFDAAVSEIWPCLCAGATLLVPPPAALEQPRSWIAWLAAARVTVCFLPTPFAALALAESWPADSSLRVLVAAGDRLLRWSSPEAPFTLFNSYGPTENTVVATATVVGAGAGQSGAPPIGRPIANVQAFVAGEDLAPLPPGAVGELCLGGASLARGYRGRPELTAARFVPDPFAGAAGGRLYRTGDLVRQRRDGALEFVGRSDRQAKVRGVRVELGEVEAVLGRHPQVREAAVVAGEDADGGSRLVAYVVPVAAPGPTAVELRAFLRRFLAEAMLPAYYLTLAALPRNANGKIDPRLLPPPDPQTTSPYTAPRNALEEVLASLWADLLDRERIGIHDDFFTLGGHSLLATQVISRLADAFAVELPLRSLFDGPTVADLARELSHQGGAERIAATAEVLLALSAMSEEEAATLSEGGGGAVKEDRL